MYRVFRGEVVLAIVTNPVWVKRHDSSSYGLCGKQEAQGVVIEGAVYYMEGRDELDSTESIVVAEISEITYQREQEVIIQGKVEQEEASTIAVVIEGGLVL